MTPYYQDDFVTLYHGDSLEVMPQISDVDLVVTSPPYNLSLNMGSYPTRGLWGNSAGGIKYTDHTDDMPLAQYTEWQKQALTAMWETLTDVGAIFYNHKPRVQNKRLWTPLELNPGLPLRQIIVWDRGIGLNFSPTHYLSMHEWIIVYAKDGFKLTSRGASGVGDVWRIHPRPEPDHPAPFPISIPARAIETTSPKKVLDPFAGIGTTLKAAKAAGTQAVGIELSEKYCELIARSLSQDVLDFGSLA